MQIDFAERRVEIGGVPTKVFLFVATLGYSRRLYVRAFGHEKQESWFVGVEGAFRAFDGVPREVLLDNARACAQKPMRRAGLLPRGRTSSGCRLLRPLAAAVTMASSITTRIERGFKPIDPAILVGSLPLAIKQWIVIAGRC